jgi:hypothetical protein
MRTDYFLPLMKKVIKEISAAGKFAKILLIPLKEKNSHAKRGQTAFLF